MIAERIRAGAPPEKEHPLKGLKKGQYYEVLNPTANKVIALRSAASRFGKRLNRTYQVRKETTDNDTPCVRIYRTK